MTSKLKGNLFREFQAAADAQKKAKMTEMVEALKDATPVATGHAQDGWHVSGDSIVNEVDYIDDLNNGSSQQAPEYFIEKTLLAQQGVSPSGTIVRPI